MRINSRWQIFKDSKIKALCWVIGLGFAFFVGLLSIFAIYVIPMFESLRQKNDSQLIAMEGIVVQSSQYSGFNLELFIFVITIVILAIGGVFLIGTIVLLIYIVRKRKKKIAITFDTIDENEEVNAITTTIEQVNNERIAS